METAPATGKANDSDNGKTSAAAREAARAERAAQLESLLTDLGVDTGDVVVFDRQCSTMSVYGASICACAKFFGRTRWDHNGVVIRDPQTAQLLFLEATLSGVKMRPLVERLLRSHSHEVALRRLQVPRTPLFREQAMAFATRMLNVPYEDRAQRIIKAGVMAPRRVERERLFHALIREKKERQRLENELQHRHHMPAFERKALRHALAQADDRYHELVAALSQTERSIFENGGEQDQEGDEHHADNNGGGDGGGVGGGDADAGDAGIRTTATARDLVASATPQGQKMFCSQLVAALYQHLGLLLEYPSANSYLPKHFGSSDQEQYLKLQADAALLPEVSLRRELTRNAAERHQRTLDTQQRAPQAEEARVLVHCLRRHPLFHTLSESELLDVASRFRRRVLDAGEVVFHQGAAGDFFYIIERGECDVLVDYEYLRKTHPMEQEAPDWTEDQEDELAHQQATRTIATNQKPTNPSSHQSTAAVHEAPLRRRKTLALPELHDATRVISSNQRVLVATNGPGSAFGDSGLIYHTPRRATVRAGGASSTIQASSSSSTPSRDDTTSSPPPVVLWQLSQTEFQRVLDAHPSTQCSREEARFLMRTLAAHPLFAELDDRAQALAVRKCFPLRFAAGTPILQQGDTGDYFYVIETGKCEISRRKPPSAEHAVVDRVIGRGASFGEAALLYNSRRGASVTAVEDTTLWCMDRASFLTITRSGSSALFEMFRQMGTRGGSNSSGEGGTAGSPRRRHEPETPEKETYITPTDLQRMLRTPSSSSSDGFRGRHWRRSQRFSSHGGSDESARIAAAADAAATALATDRAMRLAHMLLFHDASGLVNFSQFAHFHIALGASNVAQLLPEAAFRVLDAMAKKEKKEKKKNEEEKMTTTTSESSLDDGTGSSSHGTDESSTVPLSTLSQLMAEWTGVAPSENHTTDAARRRVYAQLFDLPRDGVQRATHDDLARGIATLLAEEEAGVDATGSEEGSHGRDERQARAELVAFLSALRRDLDVLRDVWRAAEFRASDGGVALDDVNRGKHELTFDANLRSGWISSIRYNPTASDWNALPWQQQQQQGARHAHRRHARARFASSMAHEPSETNGQGDECASELHLLEEDEREQQRVRWGQQATSLAAAITAGAFSRTVCAPLERLKILLQVPVPTATIRVAAVATSEGGLPPSPSPPPPPPYRSLLRGTTNMVRLGGVRSLFSGNLTHCLWLLPSLPTKFLLCDIYRSQLQALPSATAMFDAQTKQPLQPAPTPSIDAVNLLAGGLAGLTANCLLYPLDVIRGRLSVQQYLTPTRPYVGIRDAAAQMHQERGLATFYRGFNAASLGVFSYIGCNYAIYEALRPIFIMYDTDADEHAHHHQLGHPSIPGQMLCATVASLASQSIAYPFDVLRRRMQVQGTWHPTLIFPTYKSTWDCLRATLSNSDEPSAMATRSRWRLARLYRGLTVNCVKALPSAVISFVSFEKIREMRNLVDEDEF